MDFRHIIRRLFRSVGYDIYRFYNDTMGQDPFSDMKRIITNENDLVIFDVGSNVGQSIHNFRNYFRDPVIHAFEPSPSAFQQLRNNTKNLPKVKLNNLGLGRQCETRPFFENTFSDMSSFLEPSVDSWGETKDRPMLTISTLDDYCEREKIGRIDILKSDTQGFDLEVIKGGPKLIKSNKIYLIYMEIIFSDMYKNLPALDEIYKYLVDQNFVLVSFYRFHHQHNRASWSDVLFANRHITCNNMPHPH